MKNLYIGVMSGTSLDGIDVALCLIDAKSCKLIASEEYPFPEALKAHIFSVIGGQTTLSEIGEIDHVLGVQFAAAINAFLVRHDIKKDRIGAIGLHGQTLWHAPDAKYPFTMQCGDPNIVAYRTGLSVVADVRRKDMAAGGQGAPFAPAFHRFLFGKSDKKTAVVNIGGMANISLLNERVIGYDTGCGNVLLDAWSAKYFGIPYDKNGEIAKSGEADGGLLEVMLADGYFAKEYPKSTGREYFNLAWVEEKISSVDFCLRRNDDSPSSSGLTRGSIMNANSHTQNDMKWAKNVLRTLTELTAVTIANEAKRFDREVIILCGGGAKNSFLVERLSDLMYPSQVLISDTLGVSGDAMEAMMMAWLAYKRVKGEAVELKDVTGASSDVVLGGLYAGN